MKTTAIGEVAGELAHEAEALGPERQDAHDAVQSIVTNFARALRRESQMLDTLSHWALLLNLDPQTASVQDIEQRLSAVRDFPSSARCESCDAAAKRFREIMALLSGRVDDGLADAWVAASAGLNLVCIHNGTPLRNVLAELEAENAELRAKLAAMSGAQT